MHERRLRTRVWKVVVGFSVVLAICAVLLPLGSYIHHVFVEPREIQSRRLESSIPAGPPQKVEIATCKPIRNQLEAPPLMRDSFDILQEDMGQKKKKKYSRFFVAESEVLDRYKPFVLTVEVPGFSQYTLHVGKVYLVRKFGDEEFWWMSGQDPIEIRHAESGDRIVILLAFSGEEEVQDGDLCKTLKVNFEEVGK